MDPLSERNPRVVAALKLQRAQGRRKAGAFLVEGANTVEGALAAGLLRELFVAESVGARAESIVQQARDGGIRVAAVSDKVARELADTVTPPGVVGVCALVDVPLGRLPDRLNIVAVPVEIADPGNAGTLIRVSDAVGADAVVLAGDCVDPHNGKAVRSSAGSIFHVPLVRERDTTAALSALRARGLQLVATCADGEISLDEADDLLARPTAWLFGNEAHGLSDELKAAADHRVRIPIRGRAESLNLATAASICLYASSRVQNLSDPLGTIETR